MSYPSDLTDDQWALLEAVFNAPGKRGRKHAEDLRTVVDAMLYIAHTGCRWRYLPESFRAVDAGVVAVPPLVSQRHLGACADGAARGRL
jgi:transposase